MNYTDPKMEITLFCAENIVTDPSSLAKVAGDGGVTASISYDELTGGNITNPLEFK